MAVDQLAGREGSSSEVCVSLSEGICNKGVVEASEVRRVASWVTLGKGVTRRAPATDHSRLIKTHGRVGVREWQGSRVGVANHSLQVL